MKSLHAEKGGFEGKEIAPLRELFGAATDIVLTQPQNASLSFCKTGVPGLAARTMQFDKITQGSWRFEI